MQLGQPGVGHVRAAPGRRARPDRAAHGRSSADDGRPQGARAGRVGAARAPRPHAVRGAHADRARGAARAPPDVLQPRDAPTCPDRRCRSTAWAPGCSRRTRWCRSRGTSTSAWRSSRTAGPCTSACSPTATSGPTSTCSTTASTSRSPSARSRRGPRGARSDAVAASERAAVDRVRLGLVSDAPAEHGRARLGPRRRRPRRVSSARSTCSTRTSTRIARDSIPTLNSVCYLDEDAARARAAARSTPTVAAGRRSRPARGCCRSGVKELARVAGWPETARVAHLRRPSRRVRRRRRRRAPARRRRRAHRAHHRVGVRHRQLHQHAAARHHPQPVGPRAARPAAPRAARPRRWPRACSRSCTGGDGGGSIRIPAAYCGLLRDEGHLRPDRSGAAARSLVAQRRCVGPMVRSVARRGALPRRGHAGPTLTDPTSLPKPASVRGRAASRAAVERAARPAGGVRRPPGWVRGAEPVVRARRRGGSPTCSSTSAGLRPGRRATSTFPTPGTSWGVLVDARRDGVAPRRRARPPATRSRRCTGCAYESVHAPPPRGPAQGDPAAGRAARRRRPRSSSRSTSSSRPPPPRPRSRPRACSTGELNGEEVTLFGLSAPFTAPFNVTGQPACEHPGGSRRRATGRAPGGGAPPPRHATASPPAALLEQPRPGRGSHLATR